MPWLVVGLGNPGPDYQGTRHNIGFEVVDDLARTNPYKSFKKGLVSQSIVGDEKAILLKPQTFMNRSGDCVGQVARFHKIPVENLIVVHDELDFEPGQIRLKKGGGYGGHNGLKSIGAHLNPDYLRVRVGIGKPRYQGTEHVLSPFRKDERPLMDEAVSAAADAVEMIVSKGIEAAMRVYHQKS